MLVFPKNAEKNASIIEKGLLARDSCSATFSPRIFEQKRDCSQSNAIQAKVPARSESMNRIISSLVFFLGAQYKVHVVFWVQNIRLRRTPPPPVTFIPEYPPWGCNIETSEK